MPRDIKKLRTQFVNIALNEAALLGWNNEIMEKVSQKLKLPDSYHLLLFPNGMKDIVNAFEFELDESMETICINNFKGKPLRVRDKVRDAILVRLNSSHKHNKLLLKKLNEFYKLPANIGLRISNILSTVDKIWYLAGDESTDFNYYTKRALLIPVYSAVLSYYVSDASKDSNMLKAFVEERIDKAMRLAKVKSVIASLKDKIPFLRLMKKS